MYEITTEKKNKLKLNKCNLQLLSLLKPENVVNGGTIYVTRMQIFQKYTGRAYDGQ